MTHLFNNEVAKKYGVYEAIILHEMVSYIGKTMALEKDFKDFKDFYDDNFWMRASLKEWQKYLDFFTEKQIRTAIDNLKKKGAIAMANYNKDVYDRTAWYSIIDSFVFEIYKIDIKKEIERLKGENND